MNLWKAPRFFSAELKDFTDEADLETRLIIQKEQVCQDLFFYPILKGN